MWTWLRVQIKWLQIGDLYSLQIANKEKTTKNTKKQKDKKTVTLQTEG